MAELAEVTIWKFFKGKELNDYAVAGIMGNLYVESGLLSDNLQDSFHSSLDMNDEEYTNAVDVGEYSKEDFVNDGAGYGLAQWTYWSRKAALYDFAKSQNKSISDLNMQLEFLWGELSEYGDLMDKLHNAKSVREASDAFLLDFERPADQGKEQQLRRAGYAQEFYEDNVHTPLVPPIIPKRYNNIEEIPEWAKGTIQKLINKGCLKNASLDLSLDMIRIFVVNDRAGVYGA